MEYVIIKTIKVTAGSLEEALAKHLEGTTISVKADTVSTRPEKQAARTIGPSLRSHQRLTQKTEPDGNRTGL